MREKTYGEIKKRKSRGKISRHWYTREWDPIEKISRWVNTGCTRKQDAIAKVRMWQREGRSSVVPEETPTSFGEAVDRWLASKAGAVSSQYLDLLKGRAGYWRAFFGDAPLEAVTAELLRGYLIKRRAGTIPGMLLRPVSASTTNGDRTSLRAFFSHALDEVWIARNPLTASKVPKHSGELIRQKQFNLDPRDEEQLLRCAREVPPPVEVTARRNAAGRHAGGPRTEPRTYSQRVPAPPDYLAPLIVTALYSGLRRRTLIELEWHHIDLERARWRIPGECMKTAKDYYQPATPRVVEELRAYRRRLRKQARNVREARARLDPRARIFGLEHPESFQRAWHSVVQRSGVDLRFHDLRRCFLGKLREQGVSMETTMQLSSHASIEVVLQCYRQPTPTEVENAVRRLG